MAQAGRPYYLGDVGRVAQDHETFAELQKLGGYPTRPRGAPQAKKILGGATPRPLEARRRRRKFLGVYPTSPRGAPQAKKIFGV